MAQGINQAKSSSSLCASVWSSGSVLTDGPDLRWSTCLYVSGTNPSTADHRRPLHHPRLHTSHWGGVFVYLPGGNKNYFSAKSWNSLHHFLNITDGIINCVALNKSRGSNIGAVYRCAELHLTPALKLKMEKVKGKVQIKIGRERTRSVLSAPRGCSVDFSSLKSLGSSVLRLRLILLYYKIDPEHESWRQYSETESPLSTTSHSLDLLLLWPQVRIQTNLYYSNITVCPIQTHVITADSAKTTTTPKPKQRKNFASVALCLWWSPWHHTDDTTCTRRSLSWWWCWTSPANSKGIQPVWDTVTNMLWRGLFDLALALKMSSKSSALWI